jgi:hypothetical protein
VLSIDGLQPEKGHETLYGQGSQNGRGDDTGCGEGSLDAHEGRSQPFTAEDLLPYRNAQPPPDQLEAMQRHKLLRQARAKKNVLSYSQS